MVNPAVSSRNKAPTPSRPLHLHSTGIPRAAPSPAPKARPPVAGPSNSQRVATTTVKPPSVAKPSYVAKPPSVTKPPHDHDEIIKRLKKDLATTSAALKSERASRATYASEISALQSAHRLQFTRLQEQLEQARLDCTEAELERERAVQGRLKRDFAIAQFQRKESEMDAMLDEAEEKEEIWESERAVVEEQMDELVELRRKAKEADKARVDAQTETARLRTELGTLKTSIERAELKHQSAQGELAEVTKRKDELSRQIQRWESLEGRTDSQAQELQKKVSEMEQRLVAANERAEEAEEKLKGGGDLQEQVDVAEAQMSELKKVVKKIKSESSTLVDENKTLQFRIKELEEALATAHKRPARSVSLEEEDEEEPRPSTPPPLPKPKSKPKPRSKPLPPTQDEVIEIDDDVQEIEPPPPPKSKPKPKRKAPIADESEEEVAPIHPKRKEKEKARATSQADDDDIVFSKRKRRPAEDVEPAAKKAKKEKEVTARKASGSKKPKAVVSTAADSDDDIHDPNAPKVKKKQIGLNPFKKRKPVGDATSTSTWGGAADGDDGVLGALVGRDLSPVKDPSMVPPRHSELRTTSSGSVFRR